MRRPCHAIASFFASLALVIFVSGVGVIATLLYMTETGNKANLGTPTWVIVVCVIIGVITAAGVIYHTRQAYLVLVAEDERFEYTRPLYEALSDEERQEVRRLHIQKSLPFSQILFEIERKTPFIVRDAASMRFHVQPGYERILPRFARGKP